MHQIALDWEILIISVNVYYSSRCAIQRVVIYYLVNSFMVQLVLCLALIWYSQFNLIKKNPL